MLSKQTLINERNRSVCLVFYPFNIHPVSANQVGHSFMWNLNVKRYNTRIGYFFTQFLHKINSITIPDMNEAIFFLMSEIFYIYNEMIDERSSHSSCERC